MPADLPTILHLADARTPIDQIAEQAGMSPSQVYRILREHRPTRPRSPRRRTSAIPAKIVALAGTGAEPERVARLLRISRAYVYRWWPKQEGK